MIERDPAIASSPARLNLPHRYVDLDARRLSLIEPLEVHGVRPLVSRLLLEVLPHRSPRLDHPPGSSPLPVNTRYFSRGIVSVVIAGGTLPPLLTLQAIRCE